MHNKKPILSLVFILVSSVFMSAQITGIKHMIKYNPKKFHYDCFIVVTEGRAESLIQRGQFNSSYSIVVDGLVNAIISERNLPLVDNQNYQGTSASNWTISSVYKNTATNQTFLNILPSLSPSCFYNNVNTGDTLLLFCIKFDKNFCGDEVRPHQNDFDYGIDNIPFDFSCGFSIGGVNNIYKGNIDIVNKNKPIDFNMGATGLCNGTTIGLPDLPNIVYSSSDNEVATIDGKLVLTKKSGNFIITATDKVKGCFSNSAVVSVHQAEKPEIEKTVLMLGEEIAISPKESVLWTSSNVAVAIVTNEGRVKGISPGKAKILYTDAATGCISPEVEVTVLNVSGTDNIDLISNISYNNNIIDLSKIEDLKSTALFDIQGRMVNNSLTQNAQINISSFTPGMYILHVSTENKKISFKIVKN